MLYTNILYIYFQPSSSSELAFVNLQSSSALHAEKKIVYLAYQLKTEIYAHIIHVPPHPYSEKNCRQILLCALNTHHIVCQKGNPVLHVFIFEKK